MRNVRWTGGLTAAALLLAGCAGGPGGGGGKISDGKVVLAVLNDQSGVYADTSGRSSIEAVKMAVADYQAKYGDKAVAKKIEVRPPTTRTNRRSPTPRRRSSTTGRRPT